MYSYNVGLKFYEVSSFFKNRTAIKNLGNDSISFESMNFSSNRIARYLLQIGIKEGDVVAIFNEKSITAYSLMLACLKIGAIYTNLDITSPSARIEKILSTCKPSLICFDSPDSVVEKNISDNASQNVRILHLFNSDFTDNLKIFSSENLSETTSINGSSAAYIMFTSGSTGFPKGAVMSHQNLLNFIQWGKETFSVTEFDVFTNANPIYFDNSVFDFYVSLFNGASLVPLSHDLVKKPKELVDAINLSGCTIWFSVPSLLVYLLTTKVLTGDDFKTITRISFGGEGFPKNKLEQLYNLFGHRVALYNVYGPTECTCICSSYIITERDFENMNELAPLGYMSPNFSYEIIPTDNNDKNIGELCLKGPCVGLGYYNDIERTNNSFIPVPGVKYMQVMYKTGDLVEKTTNGYIHFRGRVDNQIKHMGYRIELEEIEAAFSSFSYIDEVGVVYQKLSAELGQIVAFVSINQQKSLQDISNDVKKMVPPYMVPRLIKILESLPKNQNGKIDRKQLKELLK